MKKCSHKVTHKEVLGLSLCVCCKHCQSQNQQQKKDMQWLKDQVFKLDEICLKQKEAIKELVDHSEKLIKHLEMIMGDQKLSGTYHLKERLKEVVAKALKAV